MEQRHFHMWRMQTTFSNKTSTQRSYENLAFDMSRGFTEMQIVLTVRSQKPCKTPCSLSCQAQTLNLPIFDPETCQTHPEVTQRSSKEQFLPLQALQLRLVDITEEE